MRILGEGVPEGDFSLNLVIPFFFPKTCELLILQKIKCSIYYVPDEFLHVLEAGNLLKSQDREACRI